MIGLFCAYYLEREGYEVTVLEKGNMRDGCSHGNAGMIVPSHIVPLAAPGMIAKGLRWMLDAKSPFYIKPRLDSALMHWGWLFYKHATEEHVRRSIPALRDISLLSKGLYQALEQEELFDFGWKEKGLLMLYQTEQMEHEEKAGAEVANRAGIEAKVLSAKEIQAMESGVEMDIRGGIFYPGDAQLYPNKLMVGLKAYLSKRGVALEGGREVIDFEWKHGKVTKILTAQKEYEFDEVVVAGGAWSGLIAERLRVSLPLQGGKGYSMTLKDAPYQVNIPAILMEARATVTPMGKDLRFAGTMEIVGIDLSVNMKRVQGILEGVKRFYPDIEIDSLAQSGVWSGLRPCSPDGLPYIGRVGGFQNLTVATGHGMMGLSLGPGTGKLVSEVVSGKVGSMDIGAFDLGRFK